MERGRSGGESRTALDAVCRHRRIGEQPVSQHGCWSRDGGATWAATTLTAAADNVAVDATNPQIVYASAGGILVSSDSGATWRTSLPVRQSVQTIATVPGNPALVFVGAIPGQNIFVTKWSGDGKQTIYSTYLGGSYYDYATGIAVFITLLA